MGTDGSDTAAAAVRHAIGLARVTGAQLHVVSAWAARGAGTAAAAMVLPPMEPESSGWVRDMVEALADEARASGVDVRTHVVEGAPIQALLDVTRSMGADLLVTGNRGMTGLRGVLGSVPNSLAHRAPCAVLVVPTGG
ncbi:MAG: universal stress protein [Actinomycetota bacterium]|nr:universal stress protein [Actinomycetota bacterium]